MKEPNSKGFKLKSVAKAAWLLLALVIILASAYRSCTSGYEKYGYFVQVSDEAVFQDSLASTDPHIVGRGRRLLAEIRPLDEDIDGGDGPTAGKLRWYVCSGIDCDEGWEIGFIAQE
jgi:hypothetical protein